MMGLIKGVIFRAFWINANVCHPGFVSVFAKIFKFTNKGSFVDAFSLLPRKPIKSSFEFRVTFSNAFRGFWLRTILFWGKLVSKSRPKLLMRPLARGHPWMGVDGNYLTWAMPFSTLKNKLSAVKCCETSLPAVISKISAKYGEGQINSNSDF